MEGSPAENGTSEVPTGSPNTTGGAPSGSPTGGVPTGSPTGAGDGAHEKLSNAGSTATAPFDHLEDDDDVHLSGLETPKEQKDDLEISQSCFTNPQDLTDRVKALAPTLASIPELTLDEASHVRNTFSEIMGERENITNTLELRVLLANLGFYPPEKELKLLLQAYRSRVNLSGLIRFLRFYKKDYPTTEVTAPKSGDIFSQLSSKFSSASHDPDAIRAFISLGGEDDGSGFITIDRLQRALQEFGVTVEFTEEMMEREELDFTDFCSLWQSPNSNQSGMGIVPLMDRSECSFSTLNPQTPGAQSLLLSHRTTALPRRLLSLLGRVSVRSGGSISQQSHAVRRVGGGGGQGGSSSQGGGGGGTGSVQESVSGSRPRSPTGGAPLSALHNEPMTEDERAQLLCMYLFPERYETRRTRFTLPEKKATSSNNAKQAPVHHRLARDGSIRRRRPKKKMLGWKTSTYGQKKDEESDDEDFLTQKNGGVYRPPSPMILSLRNSTAYKKHQRMQQMKRQKEQDDANSNNQLTISGGFNGTNTSDGLRTLN